MASKIVGRPDEQTGHLSRRGASIRLLINSAWWAFLVLLCAACGATGGGAHFINSQGKPLREMDHLWEEVNAVFPGALPGHVKLVWTGGLHSTFMIETHSIGIPSNMKSHIRQGKVCRMLTHLALHRLSGGDNNSPGRCFDNDVAFLEQAIAGYLDRKAAGLVEEERIAAGRMAAELFRTGELRLAELRDWEAFYYRGYWSDQFREWNLDGLRALFSLGDYLDRRMGLSSFGPVFQALADDKSLDEAVRDVLGVELDMVLSDWRDEVLAEYPEVEEDTTEGEDRPAEQETG